ncbi:MAG: SDR family NAD(P)-dependent oxidoreductase [Deltaproteobacteria bacterium]|nr:SDR family NAD(P)-dependent oxidoreductase [Deltaproteobacteria bacterium]
MRQSPGEVVLITGSAKRAGRAIALAFGSLQYRLAIHYRSSRCEAAGLRSQLRSQGTEAGLFRADLSRVSGVKRLVSQVERELGPITCLINNAANFLRTPLEALREKDWNRSLDTNLKGPFFLAREAGLLMKKRGMGIIINISDWAGLDPYPSYLPHSIAKAGLIAGTRGLAKALGSSVRVYGIAPKKMKSFNPLARLILRMVRGSCFQSGATYGVDGKKLVS